MKYFVQPGEVITVTAPSGGLTSGQGYMTGNLFGVATGTYLVSEDAELQTTGVIDIGKDDAAFAVGDAVYWDDEAKLCTDSSFSAGLTRIGVCTKVAATTDARVRVRLDGFVTRAVAL
jgi:predicted RecA/RadA family phage recombinase